jgi:5-(carboxyamino)imidazole ribonucleotide mutase
MGSDNDFPVVEPAVKRLKSFGIEVEWHVMSAHRTPARACEFASKARENGFGVIIAAAGKAAHLAGVVAAHTTLPVIGIPVNASMDGLDALLSVSQMPPGIPVATVAIDGADNAGILAAQILGVADADMADKRAQMKKTMEEGVMEKDRLLQEKY